jgi:putative peptide zinc metalloprotease protein
MATSEVLDGHQAHPRRGLGVSVHEPTESGGSWIIQRGPHHYYRVQPDLARLALTIDGEHDHAELAAALGAPWTTPDVDAAIATLRERRLLDDGTAPAPPRSGRIRFVPPLTVQFTVLRPENLLRRLAPLVAAVMSRPGRALGTAIALGGPVSLLTHPRDVRAALGTPLPMSTYVWLFLAMIATTALHEVGHGVVLTSFGGRPSRMGVMLFYLSPAFFCDVSDGWRLPRRSQRVRVALAGAAVQSMVAGSSALAAPFVGDRPTRLALYAFAVMTIASGLLNLIPLIKLDGYIALMSHLDVPHLRDHAADDARGLLARLLFGGRRAPLALPDRRWATWYGLACMAFPVYVVATALTLWVDLLRQTGYVGACLASCALVYLAYRTVTGYAQLARRARAGGARRRRIVTATLMLVGVLAGMLTLVRLPYSVSGGYTVAPDGAVRLVLPPSADLDAAAPGASVTLYRSGIVLHEKTGTAAIHDGPSLRTTAPMASLFPLESTPLQVPVVSYPLAAGTHPPDAAGTARVDAGSRPLAGWLFATYLAPVWRW